MHPDHAYALPLLSAASINSPTSSSSPASRLDLNNSSGAIEEPLKNYGDSALNYRIITLGD